MMPAMQQPSYRGTLREPAVPGDRVYVSMMTEAYKTKQMFLAERIIAYVQEHPTKATFAAWRSLDLAREYLRHERASDPQAGVIRHQLLYTVAETLPDPDYGEIYVNGRWWVGLDWPAKCQHLLRALQEAHTILDIAAILNITRRLCANWLNVAIQNGLVEKRLARKFPLLYEYWSKDASTN